MKVSCFELIVGYVHVWRGLDTMFLREINFVLASNAFSCLAYRRCHSVIQNVS